MNNPALPKGPTKEGVGLSVVIITVGVGWLLTAQGVGETINWIWTLGLGVAGILTFIFSGGVDKASVLLGPFLLASSFLSILRQTERITVDTEVPILVILVGVLLLVAQAPMIPWPTWLDPREADDDRTR